LVFLIKNNFQNNFHTKRFYSNPSLSPSPSPKRKEEQTGKTRRKKKKRKPTTQREKGEKQGEIKGGNKE